MHKGQKMPEWVKKKISESEKGKTVSLETRKKISRILTGQTGEKCRNWIGDKVGYFGIHSWLYTNFGKANKCEQCGNEKKVQWAKLRDKPYARRRENFWQLCISCHLSYDMTQEKRNKISLSLKNRRYGLH